MPNQLKRNALMLAILAAAFSLFFQTSKHSPGLVRVNPFAEDPYDAVGSFSFQFVWFVAILSLLRAHRPYPKMTDLRRQGILVARGQFLGLTAIALTAAVDGIAMFRHRSMWQHTAAGNELSARVAALFLFSTVAAARLIRAFPPAGNSGKHRKLKAAAVLLTVSIAFWYPEHWRQGLAGALLTVLVGNVILFIPIREFAEMIGPISRTPQFDLIDDVAFLYKAMKEKVSLLAELCSKIEPLAIRIAKSKVVCWLDPRRKRWNVVFVLGGLIGILLASLELADSGNALPFGRALVLISVFAGLEMVAVATGYGFLADPLALVRRVE